MYRIIRMGPVVQADGIRLPLSATAQIAGAILLGVVMLFGVGFAPVGVVHNAAHDTRHAVAFPCH